MSHRLLTALLLLALTACAASSENHRAPAADAAASIATDIAARSDAIGIVDDSCRADTDCAVKNVGDCCGYYPACVNKDSPTFPAQVQAQCQREGRMAVCGFREISACTCNQGHGEAAPDHLVEPATESP